MNARCPRPLAHGGFDPPLHLAVGADARQTIVAGWYMKGIMPYQGWSFVDLDEVIHQPLLQTAQQVLPYALQTSILILFGILFCWVSAGFWTA
jgi:membrane glycosyltransferase